ncbi:MAG: GvpL/GvpF family gas vesicle protein, partial [Dehalococcoidales bacterium]|nr:GvpL/GvpF family gas vesicle protein [Dehalococcoidales bacterium]
WVDLMSEEGKYIYCIIDTNSEEEKLGPIGIGGRGDEVYTVRYRDIAAVISNTSVMKYPVDRPSTIAHQRVMEKAMEDHTILPVRFDTVAESKKKEGKVVETDIERIRRQVLKNRYLEFKKLLEEMRGKRELGVKGIWKDMDAIFAEILKENQQIAILNKQLLKRPPTQTQAERVKLGEMVYKALNEKKAKESEKILSILKRLAVDFRQNKNFGDKMFMNYAFLVPAEREQEFDDVIGELNTSYNDRMRLKYVGPIPPCNFVEIVVTWED